MALIRFIASEYAVLASEFGSLAAPRWYCKEYDREKTIREVRCIAAADVRLSSARDRFIGLAQVVNTSARKPSAVLSLGRGDLNTQETALGVPKTVQLRRVFERMGLAYCDPAAKEHR